MTLAAPVEIPLTPIDEMFIHLGDPSSPLNVQLEVRVAGRLDETRVRAAIATAAGRHPLARARLLPTRPTDKRYRWAIDESLQADPLDVLDAASFGNLDELRSEFYNRPVPLSESPPFRVLLVRDVGGDLLMLSINHTACDGIGALRLLQSIGRAYTGAPDQGVDFGPAEALRRALPTARPGLGDRVERARLSLQQVAELRSRAATIAPKDPSPEPGRDVLTVAIPIGPLAASPLRRKVGASVNDVLLAALHRALDQWNTEQGAPPDRVAIPIPLNARPEAWQHEVVANLITSESVSTTAGQRETPEATLAAVAAWMNAAKQRGTGPALAAQTKSWGRVGLRQPLGGAMKAATGFLAGTAALSNLGLVRPDWIDGDGFDVRELWVSPPTVQTGLAVGAITVNDTLHLSLRSDRTVLSRPAVAEIADLLRAELEGMSERC
jgi:NRPS condensation-like uncharacterized protein